ncbi:MAG: flagellar biosynthesis protein FlhB [Rhodobiaceae bacterium]|jgi:flagellar biosynthetic protein FlhB|nr:flagellar biosynthesis protein FlhB [Rhodobiaceae bacterium]
MNSEEEESDKSFDATPQKLEKAREKGEIARSADVGTAASYLGLLVACLAAGSWSVQYLGTLLMIPLDQADTLGALFFGGAATAPTGGLLREIAIGGSPLFLIPGLCVILAILAQRGFVFAPTKLEPKMSRISPISNAKNKYGRGGLFEFAKSAVKLIVYSVILGIFIYGRRQEIIGTLHSDAGIASRYMANLCLEFLFIILLVSASIGAIDWFWQHAEHLRKNRMSRKEVMDESKETEGDPHLKNERRQRGQTRASNQMMADVPSADVIIVNPTHYAVALTWSRLPGQAPVCVAKGVDEIATAIRRSAAEAGVPIHHDPPTARALFASVEIGCEIDEEHYRAVALAIRFAENMRRRAKGRVQ